MAVQQLSEIHLNQLLGQIKELQYFYGTPGKLSGFINEVEYLLQLSHVIFGAIRRVIVDTAAETVAPSGANNWVTMKTALITAFKDHRPYETIIKKLAETQFKESLMYIMELNEDDGHPEIEALGCDLCTVLKASAKSLAPTVSDEALNTLNELREANLLCDAQISVGEHAFNVHRAIMSSCSSYFRAQFTGFYTSSCGCGAGAASVEEKRVIHIPGISACIMNCVIQFAYLRKTTICEDNVHELLICADYVGMVALVKQCKNYLSRTLTPENCVSIMGFARFRFLEDLHLKARHYMLRYFTEVAARNTDIMEMNIKDFYSIISDDELNTREEDHVWKLCVKWIDRNPESRKQHVAHLMTGVRMGLMTPKVRTHRRHREYVSSVPYRRKDRCHQRILWRSESRIIADLHATCYRARRSIEYVDDLLTEAAQITKTFDEVLIAPKGHFWDGLEAKYRSVARMFDLLGFDSSVQ
ncbi:ring canal kelch homolog isoform X3 [Drosophila elegans]|uniref:ring canal kelch homolog isoform X3 n=1 Tax=Drosophila elegans TaxID=30023 RepID=UPI001BC86334|nr:ring canal kelch homolog isoform X3 [Drosophila elegans]